MSTESMWLNLPIAAPTEAAIIPLAGGGPGAIGIICTQEFINSPADLWYAAPRDFCGVVIPGECNILSLEESCHGPAC